MFDFDGSKFIIIGIVALLVIGPKDLPRVLRSIGQWTGKLRRMASEFQGQFMDAMREADIDSIKKEVRSVADTARVDSRFDPLGDIRREIGDIKSELRSATSLTAASSSKAASVPTSEASTEAASETAVEAAPPQVASVLAEPVAALPAPAVIARPTSPAPGTIGSLPKKVPSLGSKSSLL